MIRSAPLASILLAIALAAAGHPLLARSAPPPAPAARAASAGQGSGVWYEIFVRSWYDTDGDGVGDLKGVTAKLDYLQGLGVDGIWLMPINPSPSYHGYDVTDYYGINPQYGTPADFKALLAAAHQRGIKVIIDLVINHTSDRHPWFQAARNPQDPHHDWYSWAKPGTDLHAISATGGQAWHALGKQHYLGIFTATMPDLDYDTPAVRQEMIRVGRYWLSKGVDGFRLDAAQHIYYDFKSQTDDPSVLAKNLAWWRDFRHGMDAVDPNAYLVGEVTRDTPQALAPYFGPLSAVFDFPLATQLIRSAKDERAGALVPLLVRTDAAYRAETGHAGVDATFLSNHDQERVFSQLDGNRQHMRMAAAMLLTLPGHPFLYYGEELGMRGRKPDEHLREPMRWQAQPSGVGETHWEGFSAHDGPAVSVRAEQADPHSLLAWYRMLIGWRARIGALRDGALHAATLGKPQLAAWQLTDARGDVLVVHNLSAQAQDITLLPALHRFGSIAASSDPAIMLAQGRLHLPAYSTAVLQ